MVRSINPPPTQMLALRILREIRDQRDRAHERLISMDPEVADERAVSLALARHRTLDAAHRKVVEIWQDATGLEPTEEPEW